MPAVGVFKLARGGVEDADEKRHEHAARIILAQPVVDAGHDLGRIRDLGQGEADQGHGHGHEKSRRDAFVGHVADNEGLSAVG